ncbi:hypothetical protein [Kitasatospora purpeofusca]|uniref:hypothetical protein n=1 Tax=Kitasatospora purpeofusca TaxID=67352 RepID=UPI0036D3E816
MSLRRPVAAAATAAVLAPLLALAAGTAHAAQGPATQPGPVNVAQAPAPGFEILPPSPSQLQLTRRDQCLASYNVNYWVGGMPFALTQLKLCLSAPATLVRGAQIFFPGDVNFVPTEPVLVPTEPVLVPTEPVLVPTVPAFP